MSAYKALHKKSRWNIEIADVIRTWANALVAWDYVLPGNLNGVRELSISLEAKNSRFVFARVTPSLTNRGKLLFHILMKILTAQTVATFRIYTL